MTRQPRLKPQGWEGRNSATRRHGRGRTSRTSGRLSNNEGVTEAIAIVSILSGAAVAIVVPFINARLERSRIEEQSRRVRLEELRGLLDQSVQHLYDAWGLLFDIEQEAQKAIRSTTALRKLDATLTKQADVIVQDGLRINIRTPPDASIVTAHREAQDLFARYEAEYRRSPEVKLPPPPPTTAMSQAIAGFMEEIHAFVGVVPPVSSTRK